MRKSYCEEKMKCYKAPVIIIFILFLVFILTSSRSNAGDKKPVKVIFETDMCLAVDDVGALAMIHGLQNRGETELPAVCLNATGDPDGAAAIDAINTWYGRGDIPVGIWKGPFPAPDTFKYFHVLTLYPHDIDSQSAPSALETYQRVLSKQPDKSVTIISTGYLQNLDELLRIEPEPVASKVKELVIMLYPDNDSFQLSRHELQSTSLNVLLNWPTPIVHCPLGAGVMTGPGLEKTSEKNPVREAYHMFFNKKFAKRSSWDQLTVLYGVRGASGYFNVKTPTIGSFSNGHVWKLKSGYHSYLEPQLTDEEYAGIVETMMTRRQNDYIFKNVLL